MITIQVNGNKTDPDFLDVGTVGSYGETLSFIFSEEWSGLSKKVVFHPSRRGHPVEILLSASGENTVRIPAEVMRCSGFGKLILSGYELADGLIEERIVTIPCILAVKAAPKPSGANLPDVPKVHEQLQYILDRHIDAFNKHIEDYNLLNRKHESLKIDVELLEESFRRHIEDYGELLEDYNQHIDDYGLFLDSLSLQLIELIENGEENAEAIKALEIGLSQAHALVLSNYNKLLDVDAEIEAIAQEIIQHEAAIADNQKEIHALSDAHDKLVTDFDDHVEGYGMFLDNLVLQVNDIGKGCAENTESIKEISKEIESLGQAPGIHIGEEAPTDGSEVWIDTDEEAASGGGASIDVTAEIGQTIVVKEVDENGKPVAWEAADHQAKICGENIVPIVTDISVEIDGEALGVFTPTFDIVVGKQYIMTVNGTAYVGTAMVDAGGVLIYDTVNEVGIANNDDSMIIVAAPYPSQTVTLSVEEYSVSPIPCLYLENALPYYVDVQSDNFVTPTEYRVIVTPEQLKKVYDSGRQIIVRYMGMDSGTLWVTFFQLTDVRQIHDDGRVGYVFMSSNPAQMTNGTNSYLCLSEQEDGTFLVSKRLSDD